MRRSIIMAKRWLVRKGNIGNKKGWCFEIYFDKRTYPNIISALYKRKYEAFNKVVSYLLDDKLDTYGSAE